MELIRNYTYKIRDCNTQKLRSYGFRHQIADSSSNYYVYKFPVEKYNKCTILECRVLVDSNSGDVRLDVYDNWGNMYPPFYYNGYGNYKPILHRINSIIFSEFKKLNIIIENTACQ